MLSTGVDEAWNPEFYSIYFGIYFFEGDNYANR